MAADVEDPLGVAEVLEDGAGDRDVGGVVSVASRSFSYTACSSLAAGFTQTAAISASSATLPPSTTPSATASATPAATPA